MLTFTVRITKSCYPYGKLYVHISMRFYAVYVQNCGTSGSNSSVYNNSRIYNNNILNCNSSLAC